MLKHEVGRIEHASIMYLKHEIRDAIAVGVAKDVGDMVAGAIADEVVSALPIEMVDRAAEAVRCTANDILAVVSGQGIAVNGAADMAFPLQGRG